jgi:hypothetical protein
MQALLHGDLALFMEREAAQRRPGHWPPFGRLAAIIVSADSAEAADRAARDLGRTAPHGDGITTLGPAPAPLSILRGRHRRRLLLKTRRDIAVQPLLRTWLATVPGKGPRQDRGQRGPGLLPLASAPLPALARRPQTPMLDATDLACLILTGRASAREATLSVLARIDAVKPKPPRIRRAQGRHGHPGRSPGNPCRQ